jgi:hypothetical protein
MQTTEDIFVALPQATEPHEFGVRRYAHVTNADGKPLCGTKRPIDRTSLRADWEWLHDTFHTPVCKECYEAAVLRLRPTATFLYMDPWYGGSKKREFRSLRAARKAASKEHCPGSIAIWQLGPGDTNRIVEFVEGLPPLP